MSIREKIIIMGAAGRDFHNFNVCFRDDPDYEVVAFTATQIPDIEGRIYPPELSGDLYPNGIPIYPEEQLHDLIREYIVDTVVFSYSDITHEYVMSKASSILSGWANFKMLSSSNTMLYSTKPVISVCAIRTGCGKSQTSRKVAEILQSMDKKVVIVRHPMPYGDLSKQIVQRFSCYEDFKKYDCTIEECEEYEPIVDKGMIVYAGVDYEKILRAAEEEADVIIWDGGNNDTPFFVPTIHIVVFDPHRAGHELKYHPGETNLYMADIAIVNKVGTAKKENVEMVLNNIRDKNPIAQIVLSKSKIVVDDPEKIRNKKVLVVEVK
jgi:predicted GTPase